jgi:hypothetical protein
LDPAHLTSLPPRWRDSNPTSTKLARFKPHLHQVSGIQTLPPPSWWGSNTTSIKMEGIKPRLHRSPIRCAAMWDGMGWDAGSQPQLHQVSGIQTPPPSSWRDFKPHLHQDGGRHTQPPSVADPDPRLMEAGFGSLHLDGGIVQKCAESCRTLQDFAEFDSI